VNLSPHFTLEELCSTRTGLPNQPTDAALASLRSVAELLEAVRAHFGRPILVHSGYRSPAVNAAIGGAKTSQHMKGEAADFHVDGVSLEDVWRWIGWDSGLKFGQLILEGASPARPTWIHLSVPGDRSPDRCGEVMKYDGTRYTLVHRATQ
jgi:hypothetical protein